MTLGALSDELTSTSYADMQDLEVWVSINTSDGGTIEGKIVRVGNPDVIHIMKHNRMYTPDIMLYVDKED